MEKIRVGQLINTHGIRGECKVKVYSDFVDERFQPNQTLYLYKKGIGSQEQEVKVTVKSARWHQDRLLVVFEEIVDMTMAERYKGFDILIDRDEIEDLEEGFYVFELIGYEVVDENDEFIGKVKAIEETGANDVIRIEREGKRDLLVPYVDAFVLEIEEETKKITIHWMEGLE